MTDQASTTRPRLAERLRERFGPRAVAAGLALLIEALLVLAILSLGMAEKTPPKSGIDKLVSVSFASAAEKPAPKPEPAAAAPKSANRNAVQPPPPSSPAAAPVPQTPAVVTPPPPIIPVNKGQLAALDIGKLPRQPVAPGPGAKTFGPAFTPLAGDSKRVGTAPNGQPLYAAAWYREPYPDELAGYLSTADGPGWALIACRTAPNWRVEGCVALDEYPSGSNLARSVLAAAWQFQVRPPRLGGVYKVGEWVRIRIDYERRPRG